MIEYIYKIIYLNSPRLVVNVNSNMERWRGKVAVVTGASAGIGEAICIKLVSEGLKVVGLARRVDRVKELSNKLDGKPGKLYAVKCDVSNQNDVSEAFKWTKENVGSVQILVNNAGLVKLGTFIEGNPSDWKTVLDTNVLGLCMCSREAFGHLKESGEPGHIIHISSIAGHYPFAGDPPMLNIYSPSKYAVRCINDIMHKEVNHAKMNIRITSISPGLVRTEIMEAAGMKLEQTKYAEIPALNSEDISDTVAYVISTPQHVNIREIIISPL